MDHVDAEQSEPMIKVVDPFGRSPVICERDSGFTSPQDVTEREAEMPSHHALDREFSFRDPLVVPEGRVQQLDTWANTRKAPKVVLGFGEAGCFEVDYQLELVALPHLVVAVEIAVDQGHFGGRLQHVGRP